MAVFQRKFSEIIQWCLFAAFAAILGLALPWANGWPIAVHILLPLALAAPFLFFLFYQDNIRIEITQKGLFKFYRLGRPLYSFCLSQCQVSYRSAAASKNLRGPRSLTLTITSPAHGDKPIQLDCGALGRAQFSQLCTTLARHLK